MERPSHWVVMYELDDPRKVVPVAVAHTEKEAEEMLRSIAKIRAEKYNEARAKRFAEGEAVGSLRAPSDFEGNYTLVEVIAP